MSWELFLKELSDKEKAIVIDISKKCQISNLGEFLLAVGGESIETFGEILGDKNRALEIIKIAMKYHIPLNTKLPPHGFGAKN